MYVIAQRIWVSGFVRQSAPAEAIFDPGRAWGIPYALEEGFCAVVFHPLSRTITEEKQENCFVFPISRAAIV